MDIYKIFVRVFFYSIKLYKSLDLSLELRKAIGAFPPRPKNICEKLAFEQLKLSFVVLMPILPLKKTLEAVSKTGIYINRTHYKSVIL